MSLEQRSDEEALEGLKLRKEELLETQSKLRDDKYVLELLWETLDCVCVCVCACVCVCVCACRAGYERRVESLEVDVR